MEPQRDPVDGGPAEPDTLLCWLSENVGLRIDGTRRRDLWRSLLPIREELGSATAPAVARRLDSDERLRRRVIRAATIGETSFFRAPFQLKALATDVLPTLRARRRAEGRFALRVWSAGCSTGEEAYTLAILLLENVAPREAWELEVLGTDIDDEALAVAAAGRYAGRSLEGLDEPRRGTFLEAAGGGTWVLAPEVRRIVRFERHSVLDPPPRDRFDVVVCRNLLIYLRPEAIASTLERFSAALRPDGALLLGDADMPALHSSGWQRLEVAGAALYRPCEEHGKR